MRTTQKIRVHIDGQDFLVNGNLEIYYTGDLTSDKSSDKPSDPSVSIGPKPAEKLILTYDAERDSFDFSKTGLLPKADPNKPSNQGPFKSSGASAPNKAKVIPGIRTSSNPHTLPSSSGASSRQASDPGVRSVQQGQQATSPSTQQSASSLQPDPQFDQPPTDTNQSPPAPQKTQDRFPPQQ